MSEADSTVRLYARHKKSARALAREAGEKFYWTGKPCAQGHLALRRTTTSQCLDCEAGSHVRHYEREKTRKRERYSVDPEHRAREQKRMRESHRTLPYKARRNDRQRERYATDLRYQEAQKTKSVTNRAATGKNTARWFWHRISGDEFDAMFAAQGNVCAVCGKPPTGKRSVHLDHDHHTGRVRGILCRPCNLGLGYFKDDVALMRRAVEYLERHLGII